MNENKKNRTILIVEDDKPLQDTCVRLFERRDYRVIASSTGLEALEEIEANPGIGVVLADLKMPGMDGVELLRSIRQSHSEIEVVIMTAYGTIKSAVEALKLGAADYITKPFDPEEMLLLVDRVWRIVDLQTEVRDLREEIEVSRGPQRLIGSSKAMAEIHEKILTAAAVSSPVLIHGETGTGKDLVAREIHESGGNSDGPFVALNCAALAPELIDSELFGHSKGAFTGAHRDRKGIFQEAHGGTLFLDEIIEMPSGAQAKLLRALQSGSVRPLGSPREIEARPRIISATNHDPLKAVKERILREDLYYRLRVIDIQVLPLRERKEDIPVLVHHFIRKAARKMGKTIAGINNRSVELLMGHPWPGNVRELENLIEGVVAMTPHDRIESATIQSFLGSNEPGGPGLGRRRKAGIPRLDEMARSLARDAVREFDGNKSKAAQALGVSRKKLYALLAENDPSPSD